MRALVADVARARLVAGVARARLPPGRRLLSSVSIGSVRVPVTAPLRPSLVPAPSALRSSAYADAEHSLADVQWLMKKAALRQDAILLGSHPAALRQLVLRFAQVVEREVECVSISRDSTEADLKQRRELSAGSVLYVNQPVVEAALNGRLLVIEGLEKAERNLLPLINNLLENREMALEDGSLLLHPDRYDSLRTAQGLTTDELTSKRLLRVHPDFMVVALGLPVPRFPGTTLDPPLRSRFQARAIAPPPASYRKATLAASAPSSSDSLAAAVDALDALDALHAIKAGGGAGGGGGGDFILPMCAPAALNSIALLCGIYPNTAVNQVLPRILPHSESATELKALLKRFGLNANGGGAAAYRPVALRPFTDSAAADSNALDDATCDLLAKEGRLALLEWAGVGGTRAIIPVACGSSAAIKDGTDEEEGLLLRALEHGTLANLSGQSQVVSALLQDHSVGMDTCLLGGKGSGKTAIARRFASTLGYTPRTVYCYADLPARDLLQRRATDVRGSTIWEDSEAVSAAINGDLLILDNVHRLPHGTLAATLGRLITDRELQLPDGRRLLPLQRVNELLSSGEVTEEEAAQIVPVHPAFRILATAETPAAWTSGGSAAAAGGAEGVAAGVGGWLGSEVLSLFHFHSVEALTMSDHSELVTANLQRRRLQTSTTTTSSSSSSPTEDEATATKLLSLHSILCSSEKPSALHAHKLTTRGLLRAASHTPETSAAAAVQREITGPRGSLTTSAATALTKLMKSVGLQPAPFTPPTNLPPPTLITDPSNPGSEILMIGEDCRVDGIQPPTRPELVPEVIYFDSARHTAVMAELLRDFSAGNHLLLLGSQGVGKNKLADRMLQLLRLEREYMQLHRDVSVAALTQTPSLASGQLIWEDSPLVRAIEHGRVLVLDEADKAPLEVTCVLRSLFADGQMALADGRRVAPIGTPAAPGILPIAKGFRAIVLANRPGYPFLGNDFFRECGERGGSEPPPPTLPPSHPSPPSLPHTHTHR